MLFVLNFVIVMVFAWIIPDPSRLAVLAWRDAAAVAAVIVVLQSLSCWIIVPRIERATRGAVRAFLAIVLVFAAFLCAMSTCAAASMIFPKHFRISDTLAAAFLSFTSAVILVIRTALLLGGVKAHLDYYIELPNGALKDVWHWRLPNPIPKRERPDSSSKEAALRALRRAIRE